MTQIFKKCKSCGNILTIYDDSLMTICDKCLTEFETKNLLDENDKSLIKNLSSDEIENALRYNAKIMKANEFILHENYQKAEESFKEAIEINENRYEAYYGIARSKTEDFTKIPDTNDYLEYAKIALSIAEDDIDSQIYANLAKLGIAKK